jgi:hypothetical protein
MTEALRLAATAPAATETDSSDTVPIAEERAAVSEFERLDALFEQWAYWCYTRRYFAPPTSTGNMLGNLSSKGRALRRIGGPDAACSSEIHALHLSILAQPAHALDTQVFMAYYAVRVSNVKAAAGKLGIGRQHFYRLLRAFCLRVQKSAKQIEAANIDARARLPHAA